MAEAKFQIGENLTCKIQLNAWNVTTWLGIEGSGEMYDSASDFVMLYSESAFFSNWDECERALSGSVIIPNGVTSIASSMFWKGDYIGSLTQVVIGKDVKKIGEKAFSGLGGFVYIEKVLIDSAAQIEEIGAEAFANCYNLETIDFHGTPTIIGTRAFANCYKVEYLNLNKKIECIQAETFNNCYKLIEFNKGNRVGQLGENYQVNGTFLNCNCIDHFTFTEETEFNEQTAFNQTYKVELNKGSNCNEDGLQITRIKTNNPYCLNHNWIGIENRYPIFESGIPFIVLNHLGKTIVINGYDSETGNIPVKHGDVILWLKVVNEGDADASPLVIKTPTGNKWIGN